MNDNPALFFLGLSCGVVTMCFVSVLAFGPMSHDEQFKKDCSAMAHGTVSDKLCVNGSKILFHE